MNRTSKRPLPISLSLILLAFAMSACGGGGGSGGAGGSGGGGGTAPVPAAPSGFAVGGTVSGLAVGASLTLRNGDETIAAANGKFRFSSAAASGSGYAVALETVPSGHSCTVANGSGTVGSADVAGIEVKCFASMLAGTDSVLKTPMATAVDAGGNIYVADVSYQQILKVTPDGKVIEFAGRRHVNGSADGAGTAATFSMGYGTAMEIDRDGNLLVVDSCNGMLRKISRTGTVSTLAGAPTPVCGTGLPPPDGSDGTGAAARFGYMMGLSADADGNLYTSDGAAVRKISPQGAVTTLSYSPYFDLTYFDMVTASGTDAFYGVDASHCRIWKVAGGKAQIFVDGSLGSPDILDGSTCGGTLLNIRALRADAAGNLLVIDNSALRKITPDGKVTTIAGDILRSGNADGQGSNALLGTLSNFAIDKSGNVIAPDTRYMTVRRIAPDGTATTLAPTQPLGSGYADGAGAAARFGEPAQPAVDASGNVYVVDAAMHVVRRIAPDGTVSLYAGTPGTGGDADGPVATALFMAPSAITGDRAGNLYVADHAGPFSDVLRVRKISSGGAVTTIGSIALRGSRGIRSLAVSPDGTIAATLGGSRISLLSPTGTSSIPALSLPPMENPLFPVRTFDSVAYDSKGNLYLADSTQSVVYRVAPDLSGSIVAGKSGTSGSVDGAPGVSRLAFARLAAMTIDEDDNLYLSCEADIRRISPSGITSTMTLPWGRPVFAGLAARNGNLYATVSNGVMRAPLR